ncbi:hypothetical protein DRJ22_03250 [Candidatus Woesearchaeota archaeon]|nr:MAG: hypothetical protein B6U93_01745 [Candidatus Woesearchaeota archaeon ex4484_78]RLE45922.1 MAG: hypothetical protein DRJ22_03250 [Candidatus Woesearchaeota archaeon]
MQAVILAAGKGARLRPLTEKIPKAMVSVNGTPLLELIMRRLVEANVADITVVVGYLKEKIIDYFGNGSKFDVSINYAVQKDALGDGDALLYAEPFITENKFLVLACDKLIPENYLKNFVDDSYDGVMSVREVQDARMFGAILYEGQLVKKIVEKSSDPPSNLANASVWYMPKEVFSELRKLKKDSTGEFRLVYAVQSLIDNGKRFKYEVNNDIFDISKKEDLNKAQFLAEK